MSAAARSGIGGLLGAMLGLTASAIAHPHDHSAGCCGGGGWHAFGPEIDKAKQDAADRKRRRKAQKDARKRNR